MWVKKDDRQLTLPVKIFIKLLLYDFQNLHGASFDADAAGNALGCVGCAFRHDHHTKGTSCHTFTAADTKLLIDHVHALGILRDGAFGAGAGALAAHDAVHDLGLTVGLGDDLDAAEVGIVLLIEGLGAGDNTAHTSLAGILFADD